MLRMDEGMPFLLRYENVAWYERGRVRILDRRVFPEISYVECGDYREVRRAVADMVKKEMADTLNKVLYELSGQMKNGYSRSDA